MRVLLILILMTLTGCGKSDFLNLVGIRRFEVGTCLIQGLNTPESWQATPTMIIREVGRKHYRAERVGGVFDTSKAMGLPPMYESIQFGHLWEDFYQPVPCGGVK